MRKLSDFDKANIRTMHHNGTTRKELAFIYHVSYGYIGRLVGWKKRKK